MKIIERHPVAKKKYGRIVITNHDLEIHERETIFCLASFGFDIEAIAPSSAPGSNNPDLIMLGTYWEMKRPRTANLLTIKKRFRKAAKQSGGRTIIDLRGIKKDREKAKSNVIALFEATRGMRRIMIIESDEKILDFFK